LLASPFIRLGGTFIRRGNRKGASAIGVSLEEVAAECGFTIDQIRDYKG
jgi:hypothetical protein